MTERRIHPAVAVIPLAVAAVAIAAILVFLRPTGPEAFPAEAHSEEENVEASVFIPFAEWNAVDGLLELAAIVTAHVEAEGTCRLEATLGDIVLVTESPASPDASTMTCGTMVIGEGIVPGEWQVVVIYEGAQVHLESAPVVVEVD